MQSDECQRRRRREKYAAMCGGEHALCIYARVTVCSFAIAVLATRAGFNVEKMKTHHTERCA